MDNITQEVIKLVACALECDENSLDINSRLGRHEKWDSMGQISIVSAIETTFNIEIDDSNIDQLLSIHDICIFVGNLQ